MRLGLRSFALRGTLALFLVVALVTTLAVSTMPPLLVGALWGLLVLTAFAGYGRFFARVVFPRARVDLGLAAAWGASFIAFVGGSLMAVSLCKRLVLLAIVELGVLAYIVDLFQRGRLLERRPRVLGRFARREPVLALVAVGTFTLCAFLYLAAVADWHNNPYDDEIAYLSFVKRLLDTGSVLEPFSFRRLSAFGGQTLFAALVAPRVDLSQSFIFDQGICLLLVVLLVLGYGGARKPPLLVRGLAIIFYAMLPNLAINTASYHSGVAFFLALYRTLVFVDQPRNVAGARPWAGPLALALVGATACTLRQNYLAGAAFVLALSYASFVFFSARERGARLRETFTCAALTALALAPWMITAWRSNRTFLFPIVLGDANPELQLKATGMSWAKEALLQAQTALDGTSVRALPILFLAAIFVRDRSARRPFLSLLGGSVLAFMFVVHAFTQSDHGNIGRYAFAFVGALALVIVVEASKLARTKSAAPVSFLLVLGATCITFYDGRIPLGKAFVRGFQNIDTLALSRNAMPSPRRGGYERLQAAVPAGAKMAILVDEGYHFDYARNPIYNLDMPGYASPAPGEPFFQGSERRAEYYRGLSIRYLAYIQPEYSRYHYQRGFWTPRLMNETELWRNFTPYLLDLIDDFEEMKKKYKVVHDSDGLIVLDLNEVADAR